MAKFYANPYDSSARGFYFETPEEYEAGVQKSRAEEFEIDFIDGDETETALAKAVPPSQADIEAWYDLLDDVESDDQLLLQIVGYASCVEPLQGVSDFEAKRRHIEEHQVEPGNLEELAERFVEDDSIINLEQYFDYDSFVHDLRAEGYEGKYLNRNSLRGSSPEAKEELEDNHYVFLPDFDGYMENAEDVLQGIEDGTVIVGMELREYAEEMLEGAISKDLAEQHLDYEAIARDLGMSGWAEFDGPDGNTYCYPLY